MVCLPSSRSYLMDFGLFDGCEQCVLFLTLVPVSLSLLCVFPLCVLFSDFILLHLILAVTGGGGGGRLGIAGVHTDQQQ